MHLTGRSVVVKSKPGLSSGASTFDGQTGQIMAYRFDISQNRVAFLLRFGKKLGVFYHDEVELSDEDVKQLDDDASYRRQALDIGSEP